MIDIYLRPYWKLSKEKWRQQVRKLGERYYHDHITVYWSEKIVTRWQVGPLVLEHHTDDNLSTFIDEPRQLEDYQAGLTGKWK
jgi:hypothetical protein